MRLAVYTDYSYSRSGDRLYAERAFAVFLARLAPRFERLTILGRLNPRPQPARYELAPEIEFIALPHYETLASPGPVLRSMWTSMRRFWRALDHLDAVWLLGPHPLALLFVLAARLRRRRVFLGVRQDMPAYVRSRHPRRRSLQLAGDALDAVFVQLSRRYPTVVVGPALRHRYAAAGSLLELTVSMVEPDDVVSREFAARRSYGDELKILSVGRLETEKNPLMLADVLARLRASSARRWSLEICGEGPLEQALAERAEELGLAERVRFRGYVPLGDGMREAYRASDFLLHTSWTEGMPQVLIEAFAAGLPVVSTDVGGIREAVGDAAFLVPAGDVEAAAAALERLAADRDSRSALVDRALEYANGHTIESEIERLARFLERPA